MRGWGLKIQIGRTTISVRPRFRLRWPVEITEWQTSLMNPKLYGFGIWITRDLWAGQ